MNLARNRTMKNWSSNWGSSNKESSTTAIMFRNENALAREGVFLRFGARAPYFFAAFLAGVFLAAGFFAVAAGAFSSMSSMI